MHVSTVTLIFIVIQILIGIGLPIALLFVGRKKFGAKVSSFFIGCLTFFVAAMVLEQILHYAVLNACGTKLTDNIWLYGLYGAVVAAVFEETGRFIALKYLLKKNFDFPNAFMYGIGHGGIEAVIVLGITGISNLAASIAINNGSLAAMYGAVDETAAAAALEQLSPLWTTPSYMFLLGGLERVFAIVLQIAITLIMFRAVKISKISLVLLCYGVHFAVDFVSAVMAKFAPSWAVEIFVAVYAVALFMLSHSLNKEEKADNY